MGDSFEVSGAEKGVFECRSEPLHSDVSSTIARPKWRRLLRAAAQSLGKKLKENNSIASVEGSSDLEAAFTHSDASGGGTEVDIHHCLKQLLEDLTLSDEETGTILIGMYHFLTCDNDLPVCLRERSEPVKEKLKRAVVHWWPRNKADHAYSVFTSRECYKKALLTPSVRANCYFTLRDQGLAMSTSAESTTSAVVSFDQAPTTDTAPVARRASPRRSGGPPLPARLAALAGGSRDRSINSINSQDTSFMLSEDSSWQSEDMGVASL